jgi:hypothetical protein
VEQVLAAVGLVLVHSAAPEDYLVAAAIVKVAADLHYLVDDSNQAVVLDSADLDLD